MRCTRHIATVTAGALVFVTIVSLVLVATEGGLERLLADGTPANYVYVMLTQLTLLTWLLAGVFRSWEAVGIPAHRVLEPTGPTLTGDASALIAVMGATASAVYSLSIMPPSMPSSLPSSMPSSMPSNIPSNMPGAGLLAW